MAKRQKHMRLFPRDLESSLKEIEIRCQLLRKEIAEARKQHRKMKDDNKLYSPIAYHTFQIALHNDFIRAGLVRVEDKKPTVLCNGTELTW